MRDLAGGRVPAHLAGHVECVSDAFGRKAHRRASGACDGLTGCQIAAFTVECTVRRVTRTHVIL